MSEAKSDQKRKPYSKPDLRVYGPMEQLTNAMWWGLFPDHLGNVQNEPGPQWAKGDNMGKGNMGDMKMGMMMGMS
jgi:hypothetical protein